MPGRRVTCEMQLIHALLTCVRGFMAPDHRNVNHPGALIHLSIARRGMLWPAACECMGQLPS